jgi:hypothetical protein
VVATNDVGPGEGATIQATPRKRPSAPLNMTATRRVRAAMVKWDAPADNGGAPITKYLARCLPVKNDSLRTRRVETTNLKVLVEGLRAGQKYRCNVRAFNEAGSSPWSVGQAVRPNRPR